LSACVKAAFAEQPQRFARKCCNERSFMIGPGPDASQGMYKGPGIDRLLDNRNGDWYVFALGP
jgi:hypothetical protein